MRKTTLLVFGTKNFNNSLNEIREFFDFTLIFFKKETFPTSTMPTINGLLVDIDACSLFEESEFISKISNKPILLFTQVDVNNKLQFYYDTKIILPLNIDEIQTKIKNLITSNKFIKNSSVSIKNYTIDKNERKLKRNNFFITLTEREIQLIELLFNEENPLTKNIILKKVWNYSENADTHTVETHIYRIRKKILSKFKDESFIINSKSGYTI